MGFKFTIASSRRRATLATILAAGLMLSACSGNGADPGPGNGQTTDPPDATPTEGETSDSDIVTGLEPIEVQWASQFPPGNLNTPIEWVMDEVERRSGGAITFERFYSGSLVTIVEQVEATQAGRIDMGHATSAFNPAEFPLWEVLGIPFETENSPAMGAAIYEVSRTNAAFKAELEAAGVHMLLGHATPSTVSGFSEPVDGVDDLDGLRLRALGVMAAALEALGVEPVSLPSNEVYESVQRGVVDGYAAFPIDLVVAFGLHEVSLSYDLGIGHYATSATLVNKAWWDALDPRVQALMTEVAEEWMFRQATDAIIALEEASCDAILAGGGEVVAWSDAQIDELKDRVGDLSLESWLSIVEGLGIDRQTALGFRQDYLDAYATFSQDMSAYTPGTRICAERSAS